MLLGAEGAGTFRPGLAGQAGPGRRRSGTGPATIGGVAEKQANLAWRALLDLSSGRPGPLNRRLTSVIRSAIRDGRLPLGAAVPPSRALADDLGVSRWTVTRAYGQLVTEGYLAARTGSATRVSWTPEPGDRTAGWPPEPPAEDPPRPVRYDLDASRPDLRAFPRRKWVDAIRVAAETASFDQLDRAEPGGHPRLRAVLAEHLNRRRGAVAGPSTISVFSGGGQSMWQVSRALLAAGITAIGVENPGSPRLWQAASSAGLELVPLPADDDGLVVGALDRYPELRAVCVGAARQVAFGFTLAPARRAALLEWARRADGLIVEDDDDAEFSFGGPALPALQGQDPDRVALLGSMSKTLSPTVSIGWIVGPRRWVAGIRTEYELAATPATLNQLALAHFIESGSYDRYLRESRRRLQARRAALVAALQRSLPECHVHGAEGGLDLLLDLPAGSDTRAILAAAQRRDMAMSDPDDLRFGPEPGPPGLLLGYGNLRDSVIGEAVAILADIIATAGRNGPR
jgi:GntR family transcriptional regulator/MocR family aminotransferase